MKFSIEKSTSRNKSYDSDSLFIKERSLVLKGDMIATIGESGKATAPHLHFEIWYNDSIIDPRVIINKYGELDVSTK